jgi:hypothetical protein
MKTYGGMEVKSHTIKSLLLGGQVSGCKQVTELIKNRTQQKGRKKRRNELLQKSSQAWVSGCPEKSLFLFECTAIIPFTVTVPDS